MLVSLLCLQALIRESQSGWVGRDLKPTQFQTPAMGWVPRTRLGPQVALGGYRDGRPVWRQWKLKSVEHETSRTSAVQMPQPWSGVNLKVNSQWLEGGLPFDGIMMRLKWHYCQHSCEFFTSHNADVAWGDRRWSVVYFLNEQETVIIW